MFSLVVAIILLVTGGGLYGIGLYEGDLLLRMHGLQYLILMFGVMIYDKLEGRR